MFFLAFVIMFFFEGYFHPLVGNTSSLPLNLPSVSPIIAFLGLLTVIILNLKKKWRNELVISKLFVGQNLKYYFVVTLPVNFSNKIVDSFLNNYRFNASSKSILSL